MVVGFRSDLTVERDLTASEPEGIADSAAIVSARRRRCKVAAFAVVAAQRVAEGVTVPDLEQSTDTEFADADVYIDGAKTKQTGLKRSFVTPMLATLCACTCAA